MTKQRKENMIKLVVEVLLACMTLLATGHAVANKAGWCIISSCITAKLSLDNNVLVARMR